MTPVCGPVEANAASRDQNQRSATWPTHCTDPESGSLTGGSSAGSKDDGVALFRQGKNTQSDHVVFPSVSRLEKQIDALGVLESTRVARTCGELSSARCRPWQTTNTGVSALSRDYHELCREVLRCLPVLGI